MERFFQQATYNQVAGSISLFNATRHVFVEDQRSGFIEVEWLSQRKLVEVFMSGRSVRSFFLYDGQVENILVEQIDEIWGNESVDIRSVELPGRAVRVIWQTLEWYPPQKQETIIGSTLETYLSAVADTQFSGVIHISCAECEAFLAFVRGELLNTETVFCSAGGFGDVLLFSHFSSTNFLQMVYYEPQSETLSSQSFFLRTAMAKWVGNLVQSYQYLVGVNLVQALNYDINTTLQMQRRQIHLVGGSLVDHHVFLDLEMMRWTYRSLIKRLLSHLDRVIGESLAVRSVLDAYNRLGNEDQRSIACQQISPDGILGKAI
jgi:hypothetical protein